MCLYVVCLCVVCLLFLNACINTCTIIRKLLLTRERNISTSPSSQRMRNKSIGRFVHVQISNSLPVILKEREWKYLSILSPFYQEFQTWEFADISGELWFLLFFSESAHWHRGHTHNPENIHILDFENVAVETFTYWLNRLFRYQSFPWFLFG